LEIVRFVIRRLRAQRALGVGIVVTLAFAIAAISSAPIFIDGARAAIYQSSFANASEPVRDIRISLFAQPTDWVKSDQQVRAAISDVPTDAVVAQGLASARLTDYAGQLILMFRDGAADHLAFTDGRAPRDGEVAIPSGLVFATGLGVGDELPVLGPSGATVPLKISGVFEPPPRTDPFFFGEDSPFSIDEGRVPGSSGPPPPVVTTRSTALDVSRRLGLSTSFTWDLYLPWDRLTWEQAQGLEAVQHTIDERLVETLTTGRAHVEGGIPELIGDVRRSVEDLQTPVFLVGLQMLLVGLAVIAGVGVLLSARQGFELAILHSRGFSRGWLFRVQLLQAGTAAVVALPIGLLFARGLAAFAGSTTGERAPGIGFPTALSTASVRLAVAAAVVAAIVLALPSIAAVRRTIIAERHHASREDRALLARLPVELVVLPVGVLALVQLRQTAPTIVNGAAPVQPLLLFAPTLLILGVTFLVVRLLSWTARALEGPVGRSRRLSTYLAGRRLARSGDASFAAALLVVLAVSLLVVATTFRATTQRAHRDAAQAFTGAAWVGDLGPWPGGAVGAMPPGTTAVTRFLPSAVNGTLPSGTEGLGIDPGTFEGSAWWRGDLADGSLGDLMEELRTEPPGTPLPDGARRLSFDMTAPSDVGAFDVRATVADPDGTIKTTPSLPVVPGASAYTLDLAGASRLLSITIDARSFGDLVPEGSVFRFSDVAADGSPLSLDGWSPVSQAGAGGTLEASGDGWRYVVPALAGVQGAGIQSAPQPLPALVSDTIDPSNTALLVAGVRVPIRPVAIPHAFPGVPSTSPFVVVSRTALQDVLRATPEPPSVAVQAWTMHSDPTTDLQAGGYHVVDATSAAAIQAGLDQQPPALAIGMDAASAIAGLALVVAGVAATLYVAQRRRAFEFAALLAMGAPTRELRRAIGREQLWLVGAASIAGLALGRVCVALAAPQLRASAGVRFPTPAVVLDAAALAAAFAALAVATFLATRAAGRGLTHMPVTTVLRGEVE
jgi:putative ABC transport system permease protein